MVTAATVEARAREGVADGTARQVDGRSQSSELQGSSQVHRLQRQDKEDLEFKGGPTMLQ